MGDCEHKKTCHCFRHISILMNLPEIKEMIARQINKPKLKRPNTSVREIKGGKLDG